MFIERDTTNHFYVATFKGICAIGKTFAQAMTNCFKEVKEMEELYNEHGLNY